MQAVVFASSWNLVKWSDFKYHSDYLLQPFIVNMGSSAYISSVWHLSMLTQAVDENRPATKAGWDTVLIYWNLKK